jgi:hypothetical protein
MSKNKLKNQLIRTGFRKAKQTFSYQNNQLKYIEMARKIIRENISFEQKIRESCVQYTILREHLGLPREIRETISR